MRLQPWTEQQGVLERVLHMQALLIGGRDPNLLPYELGLWSEV